MSSFLQKWILFIAFLGHFRKIPPTKAQDVKTWIEDTNFLNPRNWKDNQLPCANDRVIFPETLPIITFMPKYFAAKELILPIDGQIIFSDESVIELTGGTKEGDCTGKDVQFKSIVDFWFDPRNWNITSDGAFPRIPSRRNAAVPDAFQVPCRIDKVEFPAESTFQVHLDYPSTSVAFMSINNVAYSEAEFEDLLRTQVGSLLFPDNPRIRISSFRCTDETGCICGNDGIEVFPTICIFVSPMCPDVDKMECFEPIQPAGSCCPICGSMIQHKYKAGFKMDRLLNLHDSIVSKPEFHGLDSYTSKTHDGTIQSVFVDGLNNKGLANKASQLIFDALSSDMKGAGLYQVHLLKISKSQSWDATGTSMLQYGGVSSGGVAALVILFILSAGLGIAYYVYRRRQIPGFNFARFDLRRDKIELELGTTPHDELQPGDDSPVAANNEGKDKGFDNPVYGTAVEEVSSVAEKVPEVRDFVENPMFTIFEDSTGSTNNDQ